MTNREQEIALLIKDIVELCQAQAQLVEVIFTAIERVSGHIPEVRDTSVIISQWAGLHVKAIELIRKL